MTLEKQIEAALLGDRSLVVVGDQAKAILYAEAVAVGYNLMTIQAADLPTFGQGHPLWNSTSKAHWLLVVEACEAVAGTPSEDTLLDLLFDGAAALPANTMIAAHFGARCFLSDMLNDPNVPVAYIAIDGEVPADLPGIRQAA